MLDLLPDEPDTIWLYGCSPWWCILLYVMQSATVMMMGSVGQSQQDTTEAASIEVKIKRSSNGRAKWLQNLVFNASLASVYVYSLTAWFKPWHATFIESPSMNWSSFYETCLV